ncbi:MAG TPA: ATP-dependent DNA helicase UvrD2 [Gaiellaceae bacterium]|nr:ATP-dependent DNA helicase UvrD2 [Gaiellaceae bacterium]
MDPEAILGRLNAEQRRAAEAVRGPVCILAGAGSGKTTTITHRIANQVATGAFLAEQILAVTFTDKAAREMRARLAALGVEGIRAVTFHAAALAQLSFFGKVGDLKILASKALTLRWIGNSLPMPYKFTPAVDLATEVEWAKNRRLTPDRYLDGLDEHEPPIPPDLMQRVYRDYERRKAESGYLDFEDLLTRAVDLYEDERDPIEVVRARYRAFTVDEYQDVNPLQQSLLELWLGERDDVCAVGDDYQAIYSFTGATPAHLLALPERFRHATVVRLESNYRSTPEVLRLANRLVPALGGAEKTLQATKEAGSEPVLRGFATVDDETAFVVERVRALAAEGVPHEEMAVLYRVNARSAVFEDAFARAEIPFQGATFLERDAARQLLKAMSREGGASARRAVREGALALGMVESTPNRVGEREVTRQADLKLLVRLAEAREDATVADFVASLKTRFGSGGARGVHLMTLHRAKGLEFDAVFLPKLDSRELPWKLARTDDEIAEERRLLYVGMTRARRVLTMTWSGKPSRFLRELGVEHAPAVESDDPLLASLKRWRRERAQAEGHPAYVVFHDATLSAIAALRPASEAELRAVPGVGPAKIERYGAELLATVAAAA